MTERTPLSERATRTTRAPRPATSRRHARPAAAWPEDVGVALPLPQPSAAELAETLRAGGVIRDYAFDYFLPPALSAVSGEHWTPVRVAIRAARWFLETDARTVLDVGSGAGKFCVIAALVTGREVIGLEHRPALIAAATELARTFGVADRVRFVEGAVGHTPLDGYDGYYLFNPFGENLLGTSGVLDAEVEVSHTRWLRDVQATEALLDRLPVGARVVTYNGFGGSFSDAYELTRVDLTATCTLKLWRKRNAQGAGTFIADAADD